MCGEVVGHPRQGFGATERHVGLTNTTAPPINKQGSYCGSPVGWCSGFIIFQGHFVSASICSQIAKRRCLFFSCVDRKFLRIVSFWCRYQAVVVNWYHSLFLLLFVLQIKDLLLQCGSQPAFLPRNSMEVEMKAVFSVQELDFQGNLTSSDGNLTIILVFDWFLVFWQWAVL